MFVEPLSIEPLSINRGRDYEVVEGTVKPEAEPEAEPDQEPAEEQEPEAEPEDGEEAAA